MSERNKNAARSKVRNTCQTMDGLCNDRALRIRIKVSTILTAGAYMFDEETSE